MKKIYIKGMILLLHFLMCFTVKNYAANETLASGAFIINMGVTPQTYNNGLKPYGMVYDLLKNYQVPIKWVINTTKAKDGADFTYNGIQYKGGTFIIPAEFRTATVNTAINTWVSAGVSGVTTTTAITVEVYKTILFVPNWTLDQANGAIAVSFFQNAGIPASAYGTSTPANWKLPSSLNACDDIFVMPHADPTWATHQNLYTWTQTNKGNVWAGCHAVSVLESLTNPGATIQMNFLSTTGLLDYHSHHNGSTPYTYQFPSDPVMQFMGTFDGSTTNGSEQIFMPKAGGAWRSGTIVGVYDPSQQDVPSLSPGPAVLAVYGRAYGDTARGFFMYEAGHDIDKGSVAERVAAQRAFFNFSFYSTQIKVQFPYIDMSHVPGVVKRGDTVLFDYSLPPGYNAANYTTKWTTSCGGTFLPNSTTKLVNYIVPTDPSITSCVITVKLTDACGRENFVSKSIFVVTNILKNGWGQLKGSTSGNNTLLRWNTEWEENLRNFIVERSIDAVVFNPAGTVNAKGTPTAKLYYDYTDLNMNRQDFFYRIKAVDQQDNFAYSNTIFVPMNNMGFNFAIAPNPVTAYTTLNFYSNVDRKIEISCVDMTGKQLLYHSSKVNKGETKIELHELQKLVRGIYIIKVQDEHETHIQKIVITR